MMDFLKELFLKLYVAITYKNPCKICIVQACCNDKCEVVRDFEKFYWRLDQHNFQRFVAWSVIFSTFMFTFALYKGFIKIIIKF